MTLCIFIPHRSANALLKKSLVFAFAIKRDFLKIDLAEFRDLKYKYTQYYFFVPFFQFCTFSSTNYVECFFAICTS